MKVLMVSGSSRKESSNSQLLLSLGGLDKNKSFELSDVVSNLPLFQADLDTNPLPASVLRWRANVKSADTVIFCIPEYIYNMPALIKNALEWLTSSGELVSKKVLAITYTPNTPRGEKAMQSLLWSLQALDANIVASLELYKTDIRLEDDALVGDSVEVLVEALKLL